MTLRIIHGSDWHGVPRACPPADLYVFTGDMLDNYPVSTGRLSWKIDREHEVLKQTKEIADLVASGGMRPNLGSPDAPIVCVRGNHDFVPLAGMFAGCNLVHEFVDNEFIDVTIAGRTIRITGHRGIPYIDGVWNDEESRSVLRDRVRAMPMADLYLTHYAPAGVLDDGYGLETMAENLMYRGDRALHCFGHIHEEGGQARKLATVTFSNAACTVNELSL